jgi:hypothetical protein
MDTKYFFYILYNSIVPVKCVNLNSVLPSPVYICNPTNPNLSLNSVLPAPVMCNDCNPTNLNLHFNSTNCYVDNPNGGANSAELSMEIHDESSDKSVDEIDADGINETYGSSNKQHDHESRSAECKLSAAASEFNPFCASIKSSKKGGILQTIHENRVFWACDANAGCDDMKNEDIVNAEFETEWHINIPLSLCRGIRAHLNLFIHTDQTKELQSTIEEHFAETSNLYNYLDYTTAMQVIDGKAKFFTKLQIGIINYELHRSRARGSNEAELYGVFVPNEQSKNNKWNWKLKAFVTAQEIENQYHIASQELPRGSRQCSHFQKQLNFENAFPEKCIDSDTIYDTNWNRLKQYEYKGEVQLDLRKKDMIWYCERALQKEELENNPMIPAVIVSGKNYEIHRVLIVSLDHLGVTVAVTFAFHERWSTWQAKSICLNFVDMQNKVKLVGIPMDHVLAQIESKWKSQTFSKRVKKLNFI